MYSEIELEILNIYNKYKSSENTEKLFIASELKSKYYNESERISVYNSNIAILKDYEHTKNLTFPDYKVLKYIVIYASSRILAYIDNETGNLTVTEHALFNSLSYEEIYIIGNELNLINLISAEKISRAPDYNARKLFLRRPFYIYYTCYDFAFIFSIINISSLLFEQRTVFLFGEIEFGEFLSDEYAALPSCCINFDENIITNLRAKRRESQEALINDLKNWYAENNKKILENISSRKPRIFFSYGAFHNPVINRPVINLFSCFEHNGYDVKFMEEKSLIHMNFNYPFYKQLYDFKPDVVFINNFSRDDYNLPDEVFFVSWVTEPFASVCRPTKRDLTLQATDKANLIVTDLCQYFKEDELLTVNLLASPYLFKKQELTENEVEKYSCDIAILTSVASLEFGRESWLKPQLAELLENHGLSSTLEPKLIYVIKLIDDYIEDLIYNEKNIYEFNKIINIYINFFNNYLEKTEFTNNLIHDIANLWWAHEIGTAYRSSVIKWIIEAGFNSIKLYGYSLHTVNEFAKYDMGSADIDSIPKLYSGAKITVGTTYFINTSPKMLEAVFCDCMYIVNHIDDKYIQGALPSAYKENENIVFFHSRKDLIKKIKYYLEHNDERIEMAKKTKETAIEHSSHNPYIIKIIDRLKSMAEIISETTEGYNT